jgi:uncharacterized protein
MEHKSIILSTAQFKLEGDGNTFVGYASTFGNVDSYGDTILRGAYKDTLKKNGMPKMFFNHNSYEVPIGKWIDAKEDDVGLLLTGEFTPGSARAEEIRMAMKHGTIEALSIGYSLQRGDFVETETGRTIKKVARLFEVSPVTFPADKFAVINQASVKSCDDEIEQVETIRDFEHLLRDAGGFTKGAAQALTARAKILFGQRDADESDSAKNEALLARIRKLAS